MIPAILLRQKGRPVNEPEEQAETTLTEDAATAWRTPDCTCVDTALEVTAYSLSSR